MSDTPVTLYQIDLNADDCPSCLHPWESHDPEDGWCDHYPGAAHCGLLREVRKLEPVGEFVSRPWCKTHDSHYETTMDRCVDVRLWKAHADIDLLTRDDFDPLADCERDDLLVQVIPDDH